MNLFLFITTLLIVLLSYYIIFSQNITYSILSLLLIFLGIGILYMGLGSVFLFIVQWLVYAGGIVVLMLFTIYTLGLKKTDVVKLKEVFVAFFFVFLNLFFIWNIFKNYPFLKKITAFKMDFIFDTLLKDYILAFELISLILLTGIVGAFLIVREK